MGSEHKDKRIVGLQAGVALFFATKAPIFSPQRHEDRKNM
jgi:hypothetical protein